MPSASMSPVYTKSRRVRVNYLLHKFEPSIPGKCEGPRRKTLAKNRYSTRYISLLQALHCKSASSVPKTDFMTEQKAYPIWFWRRDERFRVYP